MRSNTILSIVVSITLISTILIGVPLVTGDAHQAEYGTMTIDGDNAFASTASREGWPGSGSASDPYLIQGYDIDADHIGSCIRISNSKLTSPSASRNGSVSDSNILV